MAFMYYFNSKESALLFSFASGVLYCTLFTVPYVLVARYHTLNVVSTFRAFVKIYFFHIFVLIILMNVSRIVRDRWKRRIRTFETSSRFRNGHRNYGQLCVFCTIFSFFRHGYSSQLVREYDSSAINMFNIVFLRFNCFH